ELHIRRVVKGRITAEDFCVLDTPLQQNRQLQEIEDLSLGEYVKLLENPQVWDKLNLRIDRVVLTKLLESVRRIRNEVMHFDPDPMTADQLATLKRAVRLMQ